MKKLVASRVFYSYYGKDVNGVVISSAHGQLDNVGEEVTKTLTQEAKEYNDKVESIHVMALTPLEFIEVKE